jgi:hypothetical protein
MKANKVTSAFMICQFIFMLFIHSSFSQTTIGNLQYVSTSLPQPHSVYAADIDGDGDFDVVSGTSRDTIAWFENDGKGQFGELQLISNAMDNIREVFASDLDGDGNLDILAAAKNSNAVVWMKNDGSQNFEEPAIIDDEANNVRFVGAFDTDNDGDNDVVTGYEGGIAWYENTGIGNFTEKFQISNTSSQRLCVTDVNGDSLMDIFTQNTLGDKFVWYKNNGDKTFSQMTIESPKPLGYIYDIAVGDIDGDGMQDFLASHIVSTYYGYFGYFKNMGNNTFVHEKGVAFGTFNLDRIATTNIDADSDGDVIAFSNNEKTIFLIEYEEGNFYKHVIATGIQRYLDIDFADMDKDNDLDILASSSYDSRIFWLENLTLEILEQPQDAEICPHQDIQFYAHVKDATLIRWQMRAKGGKWFRTVENSTTFSGYNTEILQIRKAGLELDSTEFRCRIENDGGLAFTDTVMLTLTPDSIAPQLKLEPSTLYLNESGVAYLSKYSIVSLLSDNCGYTDLSISDTAFSCSNIGSNIITMVATDGSGNSTEKQINIEVWDTLKPIVDQAQIRKYYSVKPQYQITENISGLSLYHDNCGIESITNNYTNNSSLKGAILNQGINRIIWTVRDFSGNETIVEQIFELMSENEYTIYPNPFKETLNIEQKLIGNYSFALFSSFGIPLMQLENVSQTEISLNLSSLASGVYLVKIENGLESYLYKIVKTY